MTHPVGIELILWLWFAHALCDYPLQGDFLAKAKNITAPIPGVPWWCAMWAHCAIHAGAVAWLTGSWWLGAAEFATHWMTDYCKCVGQIGFAQDQALHLLFKISWSALR